MKALAGRAAEVLAASGLLTAFEGLDRRTHRVRVVAYHRIAEFDAEPDLDPGLISATPADFRAQMEVIARNYTAISLDDLVAAHREQRPLPQRAVLLTFDDGYLDFESVAWPVMRELGLPAVLFVPTGFPDEPGPGFWWDRLYAVLERTERKSIDDPSVGHLDLVGSQARRNAHRVLRTHAKGLPHSTAMVWLEALMADLAEPLSLHRVLGWDALRKLAGEGVSVCSHGDRHALCTQLSEQDLATDLLISKSRIEAELGAVAPPAVFAYPASASNNVVRRAVRAAGYELAFGGNRGIERIPLTDALEIKRLPVHQYGTALFRAQLRPSVSWLGRFALGARSRRRA